MTKTQIADLALSHIGARALVDVDTDTNQNAIAIRQWFESARKEALRSHPWNFATDRWRLVTVYESLVGVALTASGTLIQVTKTTHGLVTGQRIDLELVNGLSNANGTWYVTVTGINTFTLDDSTFASGYVSGTGRYVVIPNAAWNRQHTLSDLPKPWLRILKVDEYGGHDKTDSADYEISNGLILSRCDKIHIYYIFDQDDYDTWSQDFINAFSFLLASYVAQNITGPAGQAMQLRQAYEQSIKPLAASRDARESKPRRTLPFNSSQLIQARSGGYWSDPYSVNYDALP